MLSEQEALDYCFSELIFIIIISTEQPLHSTEIKNKTVYLAEKKLATCFALLAHGSYHLSLRSTLTGERWM